jgi:ferric-dicitrate binding protein FerR (iron transport regulator)
MDGFQNKIYEDLIADDAFILWASKQDSTHSEYWENWTSEHPDCKFEFDEALKTVGLLSFNPPKISEKEIHSLWKKTNSKFDKSQSGNKVRQLIGWGTKIAAILVIPLILSVLWLYQKNAAIQSEFNQVRQYDQANPVTLKAPMGGIVNFELPDGTKVWLNSGSEIRYPASFGDDSREVNILGEAYFEVEKSDVPFLVNNPGPQVKVYGTQFNVNAYANEEEVIVALAEGKVSLKVNNDEVYLHPGEISKFDKCNRNLSIAKTDIDQYISWREGKLIFRDVTLASIIRTLERRYNASIRIVDAEVANYKYNAIVKGETFEQIFELLTLTAPIKYEYIKPKQKDDSSFTRAKVIISKDKNRAVTR